MHICVMVNLNFPVYKFQLKNRENKPYIFDCIRKKWLALLPEEWVRQHCLMYLSETKKYPLSLINVEKKLLLNGLTKRYDLVVYDSNGNPQILVECKAPTIKITQASFDQIAQYNSSIKSPLLMVTNGINHYFCKIDSEKKSYQFLKELPDYSPPL